MRSLNLINKYRNIDSDYPFKKKGTSDKLLLFLLNTLHKRLERDPTNWIVEFGVHAGDGGVHMNFLIEDGYNGVLIESSNSYFPEIQEKYKNLSSRIKCINAAVEPKGENSLDNLLKTTSCPDIFDVLLIDVDSIDYQIWQSLKNYHPNFVIIEFNPFVGPNLKKIHDIEFAKNFTNPGFFSGSSLRSIIELGKTKGYSAVTATRNNVYFVKTEFLYTFHLNEVKIEDLFDYSLLDIGRLNTSILSFKQLSQFFYIYGFKIFLERIKKLLVKILK